MTTGEAQSYRQPPRAGSPPCVLCIASWQGIGKAVTDRRGNLATFYPPHRIEAIHKPRKGHSNRPRCTIPHAYPQQLQPPQGAQIARISQNRAIKCPVPCLAPLKSRQIGRKQPQQSEPCPQGAEPFTLWEADTTSRRCPSNCVY